MVTKKKPNPEMLLITLEKLGVEHGNAVMIGDSTFDIEMGRAIDMDTIAVTWGAHTKEMLRQSSPTYMIDNFSELIRFI
jgi:phosphoglycolate phosphatase-like HAD superfamily hydrolase